MSEGRNELEKAIDVWERRHVAAVQAKREAEVVMPFLRAAIEELDSFHAGNETVAAVAPDSVPQAPESVAPAPSAFDGNLGVAADDVADKMAAEGVQTEVPNVFQPRGIAALMGDEDTTDDEAAAV